MSVTLSHELLVTVSFGRIKFPCIKLQIKAFGETVAKRAGRFFKRDSPAKKVFDSGRPRPQPFDSRLTRRLVAETEAVANSADVAGERQRPVLKNAALATELGAADQLSPADGDFIGAGHLETDRITPFLHRKRCRVSNLRLEAQVLQADEETLAQATVACQNAAFYARIRGRRDDGIGQLVRVEDGSPPCRTPNQRPAVLGKLRLISLSQ